MTVKYLSMSLIIDDIVFPDGRQELGVLGGGGPQTVWGMALACQNPGTVGLISGVNHDFDRACLEPLDRMGIDLTGIYETSLPTPRAWQILEPDGTRRHDWQINQATCDRQTHPDWPIIARFYPEIEVIHWGIHPEDPFLTICPDLRKHNVLSSIEPFKGLDEPASDSMLKTVFSQCDIFSPNWQEAVSIFGTTGEQVMLERFRSLGGHMLVLRLGADGAKAFDVRQNVVVSVPAAPTNGVVDPVGAGDAFCGAFAVIWHETKDLTQAATWGAVAASYLLEQIGIPQHRPSEESVQQRYDTVFKQRMCTRI